MTELTDDPNIEMLTKLHDITSESLELEELLLETLPVIEEMDPDHTLGAYDFNQRMIKALMTQRILLTKFAEYGMLVDDTLASIRKELESKQ